MAYALDPEGAETRAIHQLVDFGDRDVLEIGCGDGRLTWRYAGRARSVLALDPNQVRIEQATRSTPAALRSKTTFRVADIATFDLAAKRFDVGLLSWSL